MCASISISEWAGPQAPVSPSFLMTQVVLLGDQEPGLRAPPHEEEGAGQVQMPVGSHAQ